MLHIIHQWMDQYAYIVLTSALMLELLALPLPGEILMTYTGLLIYQGKLNWTASICLAGLGASVGMTLSYWIGYRLGHPFFEKYGSKMHLGPDKLDKTSQWFQRYGNKVLIIAYFIPGVRHFTGYFSGTTQLPFRVFMLYAYAGAFVWTGTFISLGSIVGPKWEQYHRTITKYLLIAGLIAAVILAMIYMYKKNKSRLYGAAVQKLNQGAAKLSFPGGARLIISVAFGVLLVLVVIVGFVVEDFIANEFADFDAIASFVIHSIFDERWSAWMKGAAFLSSFPMLLAAVAFSLIRVMIKGNDRMLETGILLFVLIGGELWEEGLRRLFFRGGHFGGPGSFPSEQTLITVIFMGFAAYLSVRQAEAVWIRVGACVLVVALSLLVGISRVYFNLQNPSDILAGYVFGGVWLCLSVILLETLRLIRK